MKWFFRMMQCLRLPVIFTMLVTIALATGCDIKDLSDAEYVGRAKGFQDKGDLEASIIELKNALRQNPQNREARWLLGQAYLRFGDVAGAEKELRRAEEFGIAHEAIAVPLAEALLLQGENEKIIRTLLPTNSMPDSTKAALHVLRGRAALALDELDTAKFEFNKALEIQEDSVEPWFGQALLAFHEERWNDVTDWLDKILEAKPDYTDVLQLKGDFALAQGEFQEAETSYQQVLKARPWSPYYRVALANAQIGSGKYDEAITNLDRVLRQIPENSEANYSRAVAAFYKKDFEIAKFYADKVLNINPGDLRNRLVAGYAAYALGQYEQARSHIEKLVAQSPDYTPARKLLAEIQLRLGHPEDAATALKSITPAKEDMELFTAIGTAALQGGYPRLGRELFEQIVGLNAEQPQTTEPQANFLKVGLSKNGDAVKEDALENLQETLESASTLEQAEIGLVMSYLSEKDFENALKGALQLQEKYPTRYEGFNLAGVIYLIQGKFAEAKQSFEKALEVEPAEPNASNNLATLALQEGDTDEARRLLENVLAKDPAHLATLIRLARVEAQAGRGQEGLKHLQEAVEKNPDALQPKTLLARVYLQTKQPSKALSLLQAVPIDKAFDPEVLEAKGIAQLQLENYADAITNLKALVAAQPDSFQAQRYLATAYERSDDLKNALNAVEEAVRLNPDDDQTRFDHVRLLVAVGQFDAAQNKLDELKSEHPDNVLIADLEGDIALAGGHAEEAITLFKKAFEQRRNSIQLRKLATALKAAGQFDENINLLKEWLEEYPQDALTRLVLANDYLLSGQFQASEVEYAKVVERLPNNAFALNNLAWLLLKSDKVKDALVHAEHAYGLAPDDPEVMDTLGQVLLRHGNPDRALSLLETAVARSPDDRSTKLHLAQALVTAKREGEAQKILDRIIKDGKPFAERDIAERLLNDLNQRLGASN